MSSKSSLQPLPSKPEKSHNNEQQIKMLKEALSAAEEALQASECRYLTLKQEALEERNLSDQREQQARKEAELEQTHLRSLFAQAPALIHILRGPDHVFEFFHPLGKELVGGRDLSGMKVREAVPEYEGQGYFELLDGVYQTGEPYIIKEMPSLLKAADGTLIERFFNAIYQPWHDVNGEIAGVLNFAVEVTDQVRARQQVEALAEALQRNQERLEHSNSELRNQRDELILLNSALDEAHRSRQFFSTMSHELRTPLASIIGFSQLLLDDAEKANLNSRQKANLERILKNAQHLLGLINQVLDLAKIEAGRMEFTRTPVDVRDLLTWVVEETQSIAIAQNLVLRAEIEEGVDSLESDPMKLRQILINLVSNALKFTEQGEVTVSASRAKVSDEEADQIVIAVKDTGIGIPSEMLSKIFEAFYQVDGSYTRKSGGTGLGLSIVSQLTTLLGGKIELTSAPGQGSTFTVILPIKAAHQQVELDIPHLPPGQQQTSTNFPISDELTSDKLNEILTGSAHREAIEGQHNLVLAVDDNPDILLLIKSALEGSPYKVVEVPDPLKVMELVHTLHPSAITLDVMMPNLNGWQLLHQLKSDPATAGIPVVVLTILSERTIGYLLGADDYLIKPFHKDVLLSALQRLITLQQGPSQASEREALQV